MALLRPVTPKRVISSNKHVAGGIVDYSMVKSSIPLYRDKDSGKSQRSMKPLKQHKESKTDDGVSHQKYNKKMVANWVGHQGQNERSDLPAKSRPSAERSAQIIKILNTKDNDSDGIL